MHDKKLEIVKQHVYRTLWKVVRKRPRQNGPGSNSVTEWVSLLTKFTF